MAISIFDYGVSCPAVSEKLMFELCGVSEKLMFYVATPVMSFLIGYSSFLLVQSGD